MKYLNRVRKYMGLASIQEKTKFFMRFACSFEKEVVYLQSQS